jgi:hypothetical protein
MLDLLDIKTVNFISFLKVDKIVIMLLQDAQRLSTITGNVNMNAAEEKIRFRFPLH